MSLSEPPLSPTPPEPSAPVAHQTAVLKLCRHCSVESVTSGSHCPECGKSYVHGRSAITKQTKIIAAGVCAVVLVIGLGAGGVMWKANSDAANEASMAANAQASADRAKAAQDADAAAAAQAAADALKAERAATVREIEASVTAMAKKDVSAGVLDGPILATTCTPAAGGSVDYLTDTTTKFSCFAATKTNNDGTLSGYNFHALMNWTTGSYTYGLGE